MNQFTQQDYWLARRQHAMFLRLEGLKLREVGVHLGVNMERARQMIIRAKYEFARSVRRSRLILEVELHHP